MQRQRKGRRCWSCWQLLCLQVVTQLRRLKFTFKFRVLSRLICKQRAVVELLLDFWKFVYAGNHCLLQNTITALGRWCLWRNNFSRCLHFLELSFPCIGGQSENIVLCAAPNSKYAEVIWRSWIPSNPRIWSFSRHLLLLYTCPVAGYMQPKLKYGLTNPVLPIIFSFLFALCTYF